MKNKILLLLLLGISFFVFFIIYKFLKNNDDIYKFIKYAIDNSDDIYGHSEYNVKIDKKDKTIEINFDCSRGNHILFVNTFDEYRKSQNSYLNDDFSISFRFIDHNDDSVYIILTNQEENGKLHDSIDIAIIDSYKGGLEDLFNKGYIYGVNRLKLNDFKDCASALNICEMFKNLKSIAVKMKGEDYLVFSEEIEKIHPDSIVTNTYYDALMHIKTIDEIAFGNFSDVDPIIYIKENDEYVNYYVFNTDKYVKNTVLILREEPFGETYQFNSSEEKDTLYCGSDIDDFLEHDVFNMYDVNLKNKIVETPIVFSIDGDAEENDNNKNMRYINRHVFLLSESDYIEKDESPNEKIPYLKGIYNKMLWLRPEEDNNIGKTVNCLFHDMTINVSVCENGYVRPGFLIPYNTKIELFNNAKNGKYGFIIY